MDFEDENEDEIEVIEDSIDDEIEIAEPARVEWVVETPTGALVQLLNEEEQERYIEMADRYQADNKLPNSADKATLDQILFNEIMCYRWQRWVLLEQDYEGEPVTLAGLQKSINDFSKETRELKKALGIDKLNRDKDKGDCHDDQTEVLTLSGWKLFRDVDTTEPVATRNEFGELEYQIPTAAQVHRYTGELYVHESNRLNFAVTPRHRMLHRGSSHEKLERIQDMNASNYNYKIIKTAVVGNREPNVIEFREDLNARTIIGTGTWTRAQEAFLAQGYPTLPLAEVCEQLGKSVVQVRRRAVKLGVTREIFACSGGLPDSLPPIPVVVFAKFLGFFLAEGEKKRGRTGMNVRVCQSKPSGIRWMDSLATEMIALGWPVTRSVRATGEVWWTVKSRGLVEYMRACQGEGHELHIPQEVFEKWTLQEMQALYEGMCVGDGTADSRRGGYTRYSTSSLDLADDFQRLLAHIGKSGWLNELYPAGPRSGSPAANYPGQSVSIRDSEYATYKTKNVARVPYDGYVYCLTVPNGTLLTRRNGVVMWSGNSVAEYISNLRDRAMAFGIKRNLENVWALTAWMELVAKTTFWANSNEDERKEFRAQAEDVLEWIVSKHEEVVEMDRKFRQDGPDAQKLWVQAM